MHKRLQEERQRLGLTQDEFAEIGGVKRRAQINYESGDRCPDGHYFSAIAAAGADVQYILTGKRSLNPPNDPRNTTQQLYLVKSSTEAIEPLHLDKYRAAELQSILCAVARGNGNAVAEAMVDYAGSELTIPEKDLLAAYRKVSDADRTVIERVAVLASSAPTEEANIDGGKNG